MPDRKTHLSLGFVVGCFHVVLSLYIVRIQEVIFSVTNSLFFTMLGLGTVGLLLVSISTTASILPDFIEPPTSKYHRGFFHSQVVLICASILDIICILVAVMTSDLVNLIFADLLAAMLSGYISHLLLDYPLPKFTRKKPFYYLYKW